jgi:hypothetical protein
MLFMHSSTGLAIRRKIVVLCRFFGRRTMQPAPFLFPSAVKSSRPPTKGNAATTSRTQKGRATKGAPLIEH